MDEKQQMVIQFEEEGFRVQLSAAEPVICWLWRADHIVCIGVGRSEVKALQKVRKRVDEGDLIPFP